MPQSSTERISSLEDTVRSSIDALWHAWAAQREIDDVDIHKEVNRLVSVTIQSLAEKQNARQTVNQLPIELFSSAMSFLDPRDRCRAVMVCRSWRTSLLGVPSLWTRICVSQIGCTVRNAVRSAALLQMMLARSKSLPLCIEFRCMEDEHDEEHQDPLTYDRVAVLIGAQMFRVRSLSLLLPAIAGTAFESVLESPAPILASFTLYLLGNASEYVPESLFSGQAPCLRSLTLSMADFAPDSSCSALQAVTEFVHDAVTICPSDIDAVARLLPALRSLTIVGIGGRIEELTTVCPQPLALRLPCTNSIQSVINSFPNAASVCLSSAMVHSDEALKALLESMDPPASVELEFRTVQWIEPTSPCAPPDIRIALRLDGRDVAVDLRLGHVETTLDFLTGRLHGLHSISVEQALWPLAEPHLAVPSVRELTMNIATTPPAGDADGRLLADGGNLRGETRPPCLALSLLRLASRTPDLLLEESFVSDLVARVTDLNALRTLKLRGVELLPGFASTARLRALVPHVEIVHEHQLQVEPPRPWFWMFPEDEAIVI